MKNKIFVLGSINTDLMISTERMPKKGETIAGFDFQEAVGGKGGNQAATCAKLGACTYLIACVGNDNFGEEAVRALSEFNVNTNFISRSTDSHTGTAIILQSENDNRIILSQGANGTVTKENIEESLAIAAKGDYFLSQFEIPKEVVYFGLKRAKEKDLITVLNPAPASSINEDIYKFIDYLIINQSEAEILTEIFPTDVKSCQRVVEKLSGKGVKNVLITLGAKGCFFYGGKKILKIEGHKIDVIDTTGAGDTFIGAFLAALLKQFDIIEALEFANIAGGLACSKFGAQNGIPTLQQIIEYKKGDVNNE